MSQSIERMSSEQKGFTLVELLVVIGIVTLLVAMLLPALNRARWQSRNIQCAAQMRDVAMGVIMYANANKDKLPPFVGDDGSGYSITRSSTFDFDMIFQLGGTTSTWQTPITKFDGYGLGRVYRTGFIKSSKVLYCPSADPAPADPDNNYRSFFNYALNPHIAYHDGGAGVNAVLWWTKLSGFGRITGNQMLVRTYSGGILTKTIPTYKRALLIDPMKRSTSSDDKYITHISNQRRAFNIAYADGSVQTVLVDSTAGRDIDTWQKFLDFSGALQDIADGAQVTWIGGTWKNGKYQYIPVFPN